MLLLNCQQFTLGLVDHGNINPWYGGFMLCETSTTKKTVYG